MAGPQRGVQLWLPGDLTDPGAPPSHRATHVGGAAAFPGERAPSEVADAVCRACGAQLALVLQARA